MQDRKDGESNMNQGKQFKLSEKFLAKYKEIIPPFGFNGLGYLVYMRTYSRMKENGENEMWWETVQRVVEGTYHMQQAHMDLQGLAWDAQKAQKSAQEMFDRIFNMKFLPPGRGLWAMGSPITKEKGIYASLNNCAFVSTLNIKDDLSKPFVFLMDASMLGVGVGFDTKGAGQLQIKGPNLKRQTENFVIPDTREGWVESLKLLLESYFLNTPPIEFDYNEIRLAGVPIKGFGGVASGPQPLKDLHESIRRILDAELGKSMSSTVIVDIMNLIGKCVVAGNVRRTAEIVFGEIEDEDYLDLKNYNVNPHRAEYGWTSNNSIFAQIGMDYKNCAERTRLNGEPGYAWLENMKGYSRMNNGKDNKDHRASGGNPCLEQTLESMELCVGGLTKITHKNGCSTISGLVGKSIEVWNGEKWSKTTPRITGSNRELFRVHLSDGSFLDCTKNHGWSAKPKTARKFRRMETCELEPGTKIEPFEIDIPCEGFFEPYAYEYGLFTGDGYVEKSGDRFYPMLSAYGCKEKLKQLDIHGTWRKSQEVDGATINRLNFKDYLDVEKCKALNDKTLGLPDWVFEMDHDSIVEFLAGYIETDGNVCEQTNTDNFRVFGVEPKMRDLQILLRRIGINHTSVYRMAKKGEETEYGIRNYDVWVCYIPSYECDSIPTRIKIANKIGSKFKTNNAYPTGKLIDASRKQRVVKIEKIEGLHTTYCFDEPEMHMGVFGNVLTYQCCLVETFPNRHDNLDDYKRTLKYAYLYAKTVTLGKTHWPETNRVMLRNRRIGCSMSGVAQFITKRGLHQLKEWCEAGYETIQYYDQVYSDWFAIPKSIKTTSIKPSGTVSLLAGATPGMHYPESRFYIRRVRLAKNSPLQKPLRKAGYKIEPCVGSEESTVVVEIPVDVGEGIRTIREVGIWEQFALAAFLQKYWADNQVSCTVTFDPSEGDQIEPCLNYFQYQLKGISLLPRHDGGAYPQMPYEKIEESTYQELCKKLKKLDFSTVSGNEAEIERFCDGEACTIETGGIKPVKRLTTDQ